MTIAYPDWLPDAAPAPDQPRARAGLAAFVQSRRSTDTPRHRWKSVAISVLGHAAILYIAFFVSFVAPRKHELESITVSITPTQVKQPDPLPVPKLKPIPEAVHLNLPPIETVAPPSPNAIMAAPPPPATVPSEKAKEAPEAVESPPRFDADYLNNPAPVYPNMSRRLRETGVVLLRVRVSAAGLPLEIQLSKSAGYDRLDESAKAAVQKWKFQPAKRNGEAIEAWVIVPVDFSLTKR